jgi:hypothetical protein
MIMEHGSESLETITTRTRVDVGSWWGKRKVHATLAADGLRLSANGCRPYHEQISWGELTDSLYNHTTGELVLAPAEEARIKRLKVSPLDATQILKYVTNR